MIRPNLLPVGWFNVKTDEHDCPRCQHAHDTRPGVFCLALKRPVPLTQNCFDFQPKRGD